MKRWRDVIGENEKENLRMWTVESCESGGIAL